jgi:hypothetical protein
VALESMVVDVHVVVGVVVEVRVVVVRVSVLDV